MKYKINLVVFVMVWYCAAAPKKPRSMQKLRNPFSCAHSHGTEPVPASAQKQSEPHSVLAGEDVSSEWRVVTQKDSVLIMQHKDGSIREVTVGKS